MTTSGVLVPIMVLGVLGILLAVGSYVIVQVRSGSRAPFSFRFVLNAYLYCVSLVAMLVLLAGGASLVKSGLAVTFGKEFSYYASRPSAAPVAPPPSVRGEVPPGLTDADQKQLRQRELDLTFRRDLLQGISTTLVGGAIWAIHWWGRRRTDSPGDEGQQFLRRVYVAGLLLITSLVAIFSAVSGVSEILQYYLIDASQDPSLFRQPPGGNLAAMIVFIPAWLLYLSSMIRELRRSGEDTSSSPGVT